MIGYAIARRSPESSNLCIFIGNMSYEFKPGPDSPAEDFDSYILQQIYYGESIFCMNREPLCVLRDIELGDMIEYALKSLPGTGRRGNGDRPAYASMASRTAQPEYITNLGFYELRYM
jgi:hypothetical protein